MPTEIERKFLVVSDAWRAEAGQGNAMRQAIILSQNEHTLRVRIFGDGRAKMTLKVGIDAQRRHEFEYDIPPDHAAEILDLALGREIAKTRYEVPYRGYVWEVDCYQGDLSGLVIAEVEMDGEGHDPELPPWLGREVTEDRRFSNHALAEGSLGENWRDALSD
jgi:adenylate cyclase